MTQSIQHITQTDTHYPTRLKDYLKTDTPETIWMRGNIGLLPGQNTNLNGDLWALFCSSKCPGEIILKAHDLAQKFKERGIPTIGGYHSPVEKECLRVYSAAHNRFSYVRHGVSKICDSNRCGKTH